MSGRRLGVAWGGWMARSVGRWTGSWRTGWGWHRALMLAAIAPVALVVGQGMPRLVWEITGLRAEWERVEDTQLMDYVAIGPKLDFSQPPENWVHDSGGETWLWAGWFGKAGHDWFRVPAGQLDVERLSTPMGRDVIRAIDVPIVERRGEDRWERLSDRAVMYVTEVGGEWTAYPLHVLQKVLLVNDEPGGVPVLVLFESSARREAADQFDARVPGRGRVTFGAAGYHLGGELLLYDRATRSLWVRGPEGLEAVAGELRGVVLPRRADPVRMSWGEFSSRHGGGRLIVGADRRAGLALR